MSRERPLRRRRPDTLDWLMAPTWRRFGPVRWIRVLIAVEILIALWIWADLWPGW